MLHGNNQPSAITPAVKSQAAELEIVRTIQAGHPTYVKFLTKFTNEDPTAFKNRKDRPNLFDSLTPAVEGVVGKILRSDPELQPDVSEGFLALTKNIDNVGTGFIPFLNNLITDAIWSGHSFVLVDHTITDTATNRAEELAQGN